MKRTPLRKRGRRAARNAAADREWRRAVLGRDKYECVKCHKNYGHMEAHHILSKQARPDLRNDLDNGATLCVDGPGFGGCHYNYAHGPNTVAEAREFLLSRLTPEARERLTANGRGEP